MKKIEQCYYPNYHIRKINGVETPGSNPDKSESNNLFEFPLAKANYLLNHTTEAGVGGDKRKFWREVMGFDNPEAIREAILEAVSLEILQKQDTIEYGDRYRAYVKIRGSSGQLHRIRTVWIVLTGEDVAKFVTAVPASLGE